MKKILLSFLTIGVVAVVALVASQAFFSDTETSTGNQFVAGAIDLKVDYASYYNRPVDGKPDFSWEARDLTEEKFFSFSDLKPGDYGEGTISLHVTSNPFWACVNVTPTMNDDVSSNEPELESGDVANTDSIFDGELAQNMHFKIWADLDCNNIWVNDEPVLTEGTGPITPRSWAIADSSMGNPLNPDVTYCLGVAWDIPNTVGNIIQTDKYMADISFYVEQSRHNDKFLCPVKEGFPTQTLRLENEREVQGGPWEVIVDGKYVDITYNSSGSTFIYSLDGHGLPANTNYDLIYYADGWPGNHPGALIGKHSTDGAGALTTTNGNVDLGMDLPHPSDGNYAIGAKIWMIPDAAYDDATKSVIAWPPDFNTWLFEGNVYIHYDDTDIP